MVSMAQILDIIDSDDIDVSIPRAIGKMSTTDRLSLAFRLSDAIPDNGIMDRIIDAILRAE